MTQLDRPTIEPKESAMSSESLLDVAARVAPAPASREGANRVTWVKHYAALALAAYATFRAEVRTVPRNPEPGSRPDLGYLITAAVTATATAVALADQSGDAPKLIWDLTPEAGALNGEWEEWLADTLVRYGVNPGHIDPDLNPADFTEALRTHGPSNQPYVCPGCGETAYLHFPECPQAATQPTAEDTPHTFRTYDAARDSLSRYRDAITAENAQWQAEMAHLRDLIGKYGDDGMISVVTIRNALRDGPPPALVIRAEESA